MKALPIYFILLLITFSACRKEIDIDLNDANPRLVIAANYNASADSVHVRVTKSGSFFDTFSEEKINTAIVTLIGPDETPFIIPNVGDGIYKANYSQVVAGATYRMIVTVDGTDYEASSILMPTLQTTSIDYAPFVAGEVGGPNYIIYYRYQDIPGFGNYYKAIRTLNGKREDKFGEYSIGNDDLTDGNEVILSSIGFYDVGDEVSFEIQSINERTYRYYNELASGTSQNAAAQGNPNYVWSNQALGYFSVYTTSTLTVSIQ